MLISFSWLRKVKGLEEKTEPSSLNFLLSKEVYEDLASEATEALETLKAPKVPEGVPELLQGTWR